MGDKQKLTVRVTHDVMGDEQKLTMRDDDSGGVRTHALSDQNVTLRLFSHGTKAGARATRVARVVFPVVPPRVLLNLAP